jgi:hypothetical protein
MKIITFSRTFPSDNNQAGKPTYFVEQILNELGVDYLSHHYLEKLLNLNHQKLIDKKLSYDDIDRFFSSLVNVEGKKLHTIRNGNRFKQGELFQPCIWSDVVNPKSGRKGAYHSPQIKFWEDIEVKQVISVDIWETHEVCLNNNFFATFGSKNFVTLAKNDGLSQIDMRNWFNKLPFSGQVISWSNNLPY